MRYLASSDVTQSLATPSLRCGGVDATQSSIVAVAQGWEGLALQGLQRGAKASSFLCNLDADSLRNHMTPACRGQRAVAATSFEGSESGGGGPVDTLLKPFKKVYKSIKGRLRGQKSTTPEDGVTTEPSSSTTPSSSEPTGKPRRDYYESPDSSSGSPSGSVGTKSTKTGSSAGTNSSGSHVDHSSTPPSSTGGLQEQHGATKPGGEHIGNGSHNHEAANQPQEACPEPRQRSFPRDAPAVIYQTPPQPIMIVQPEARARKAVVGVDELGGSLQRITEKLETLVTRMRRPATSFSACSMPPPLLLMGSRSSSVASSKLGAFFPSVEAL
mmetsp:Transcript_63854/g.152293  ORF Transcript_63854/g.152293 Transcript_63854/m.152293 type:complete len:328 (-) Transcript_63854:14-997(-)